MDADLLNGLSSDEAKKRLETYGRNNIPEEKPHPVKALLLKFWSPISWMLEAAIVLEIMLRHNPEAVIIGFLLIFNALLSFFQERKAQNALDVLKQRLSVNARILRDGRWNIIDASLIVPGDIVHVRMGDIVPADIEIVKGQIELDQSALTGESLPVEAREKSTGYSGSIVKRGEATGIVKNTGKNSFFGKTAQLVKTAKTQSHLERLIFRIVRYLVLMDFALAAILVVYSLITGFPLEEMLPFTLILLIASVPVALPATFTLGAAIGSLELSKKGVLTTHLPAIEEAAAMEVLCSDKTGTITENKLTLKEIKRLGEMEEDTILFFACMASDEASEDPIDSAVINFYRSKNLHFKCEDKISFTPFDPTIKRTEAVFMHNGEKFTAIKGAAKKIAELSNKVDYADYLDGYAKSGYRVLGVAVKKDGVDKFTFVGLLALEDPPRQDSKKLIESLHSLGVKVVMVTGDSEETARTIGKETGIGERVCLGEMLSDKSIGSKINDCDIFAGVYPEDKYNLVVNLQKNQYITGMTGDGVNDSPALKQAEVGIAVSNATDVAKAAASLILTSPGLSNIVDAVKTSREIYQRMLTYTLNKIAKTIQVALFLSTGVFLVRYFVTTPFLIILLLLANDFVTMSLAVDNAVYSDKPDRWNVGQIVLVAVVISFLMLIFSYITLYAGINLMRFDIRETQTFVFLMLVFTGQATVYMVRTRDHLWNSKPGKWVMISSVADIIIISLLAVKGIFMSPIPIMAVLILLLSLIIFVFMADFIKIRLFKALNFR